MSTLIPSVVVETSWSPGVVGSGLTCAGMPLPISQPASSVAVRPPSGRSRATAGAANTRNAIAAATPAIALPIRIPRPPISLSAVEVLVEVDHHRTPVLQAVVQHFEAAAGAEVEVVLAEQTALRRQVGLDVAVAAVPAVDLLEIVAGIRRPARSVLHRRAAPCVAGPGAVVEVDVDVDAVGGRRDDLVARRGRVGLHLRRIAVADQPAGDLGRRHPAVRQIARRRGRRRDHNCARRRREHAQHPALTHSVVTPTAYPNAVLPQFGAKATKLERRRAPRGLEGCYRVATRA